MTDRRPRKFPSPFEVLIPAACKGWEERYPHYLVFSEDRREFDESRFWFQDGIHAAEPIYPFDSVVLGSAAASFCALTTRMFVAPPSKGAEVRLLNGYYYISANSVTDEHEVARRAELFADRGGYYYAHWDELYAGWRDRVETEIRTVADLVVPDLPDVEDVSIVREGLGIGSGHALLVAYDTLLQSLDRIWHYHSEFLGLGYGAYLVFYDLCREAFPGIPDTSIAGMIVGIDVLVLRPDDELRRLAQLAHDLGVGPAVKGATNEDELRAALERTERGKRWLAEFEEAKDPWFNFSSGNAAYYHDHRSWNDEPALPIGAIGSYVARLQAGEEIARPYDAVLAERERVTAEYRALLPAESRRSFDDSLTLARTVYPFIENHNFYIDHWYHTLFWNKVREFGALLVRGRFLGESEDVFYLRHEEVRAALDELRADWSTDGAGWPRGPGYWPPIVERRRAIHAAMREWSPPPALGPAPDEMSEPVAIMLWGITDERIDEWLGGEAGGGAELSGFGGSPGLAEGLARVVLHPEQLDQLEPGDILVAPSTSTSWTPVFGTIAAAVLDSGGMMSHAAIVAREYGLPAVVGTGTATKRIKTGDRVRVDGSAGTVTILS